MQGPDLLYIAFGTLFVFAVIIGTIVIRQDWREKHTKSITK